MKKVVVVGGGASGIIASIFASINNEVIIPNITNEEYFNYSTTATCVLDGLETFKYNLDNIKSLINKEVVK